MWPHSNLPSFSPSISTLILRQKRFHHRILTILFLFFADRFEICKDGSSWSIRNWFQDLKSCVDVDEDGIVVESLNENIHLIWMSVVTEDHIVILRVAFVRSFRSWVMSLSYLEVMVGYFCLKIGYSVSNDFNFIFLMRLIMRCSLFIQRLVKRRNGILNHMTLWQNE
jgi:hypothetical protein